MRFRNLQKWTLADNMHGLLFFAQRMEELLFPYTLDSHKPNALNPPSLCKELLRLLDESEAGRIHSNNIDHVLDELRWQVKHDPVTKKLLDFDPIRYMPSTQNSNYLQLRTRIEVLERTLNPYRYLDTCHQLLHTAICKPAKKDIDTIARTLVTTLVNIGFNKRHLYAKTINFFYRGHTPKISSPDQINDFLQLIYPYIHDYEVYFLATKTALTAQEPLDKFRIEVVERPPDVIHEFSRRIKFAPETDQVYLKVDSIRAHDPVSARIRAEHRLDSMRNLLTFFHHNHDLKWRPRAVLKQCCLSEPVVTTSQRNAMEKSFDYDSVEGANALNWLLENFNIKGNSRTRFRTAMDLHGICSSTEIPENQLLNLWTAIETIVPAQFDKNKINNVISSINPFIQLSYIRKLIDRFTSDLLFWNASVTYSILNKVTPRGEYPLPIKILFLLSLSENQERLDNLYDALRDFHLLRYRAFTLCENLSKPKNIKALLDRHETKIAWQLRRVYRTRNIVVHQGKVPPYMETLIENMHDYLDLTLAQIIELSCGSYRTSTLEQAFDITRLDYERYKAGVHNLSDLNSDDVRFLYHNTLGSAKSVH